MRKTIDLRSAFGEADEGFKNNVYLTLSNLQKGEERFSVNKTRRINLRLAVAVAVICVMFTTATALALSNAWGILDFFIGRHESIGDVLPEATEIVQQDPPQEITSFAQTSDQVGGQTDKSKQLSPAEFSVREAVYDGQNVYIAVEVKPTDPSILLLGADAMPDYPVSKMGPPFEGIDGTIEDYANENRNTMLRAYLYFAGEELGITWSGGSSLDCVLEDNGILVYMLSASIPSEAGGLDNLKLRCGTIPFIKMEDGYKLDVDAENSAEISVALQNTGAMDTVTSVFPIDYTDFGVRVDTVTLTGSQMAVYTKIEYTVIDSERYAHMDGGLLFAFVDENGEIIATGAATSGSTTAIGKSETSFIQKGSLEAMQSLPQQITLRAYNAWEQNGYEDHTVVLK